MGRLAIYTGDDIGTLVTKSIAIDPDASLNDRRHFYIREHSIDSYIEKAAANGNVREKESTIDSIFWLPEAFMTIDQRIYFTGKVLELVSENKNVTLFTNCEVILQSINNAICLHRLSRTGEVVDEITLSPVDVSLYVTNSWHDFDELAPEKYGFVVDHLNSASRRLVEKTAEIQEKVSCID